MDRWVRDEERSDRAVSRQTKVSRAAAAKEAPASRVPHTKPLPTSVAFEIRESSFASTQRQREHLLGRAEQAIAAYESGRFPEALRLAKSVLTEAPSVAAISKVAGLASYRLGRWREAIKHLEIYTLTSGDIDQTPALMDCYRALGRTVKVAELWTDLRRASPSTEVMAEARIVGAGALADTGDLGGAISLLAGGGNTKALRNPAERHLRQWYALGDLYERAGDVPRARDLFMRVAQVDPDAYDVRTRLESLGRQRRSGRAKPARPGTGSRPSEKSEKKENGTDRARRSGRAKETP
jgi:tetratricopeptide (TPR) repeat protein